MSVFSKIFVFLTVAGGLLPHAASASPWGQEQGRGLLISRVGYFAADTDDGTFRQLDSGLYAEYGLNAATTIGGQAIYATQEVSADTGSVGDGWIVGTLFAQRTLWKADRDIVASRISFHTPTEVTRLQSNGTAVTDGADGAIEAAFLFGRSFGGARNRFGGLEAGYRASLGDDSDALRFDFVAGQDISDNVQVFGKVYNRLSLGNGSADGQDFSISKIEGSLAWSPSRRTSWELGAGVDLITDNTQPGASIFASYWSRF